MIKRKCTLLSWEQPTHHLVLDWTAVNSSVTAWVVCVLDDREVLNSIWTTHWASGSVPAVMKRVWLLDSHSLELWWRSLASHKNFFDYHAYIEKWQHRFWPKTRQLFHIFWWHVNIDFLVNAIFDKFSLEQKEIKEDWKKYLIYSTDVKTWKAAWFDVRKMFQKGYLKDVVKSSMWLPIIAYKNPIQVESDDWKKEYWDTFQSSRPLHEVMRQVANTIEETLDTQQKILHITAKTWFPLESLKEHLLISCLIWCFPWYNFTSMFKEWIRVARRSRKLFAHLQKENRIKIIQPTQQLPFFLDNTTIWDQFNLWKNIWEGVVDEVEEFLENKRVHR